MSRHWGVGREKEDVKFKKGMDRSVTSLPIGELREGSLGRQYKDIV